MTPAAVICGPLPTDDAPGLATELRNSLNRRCVDLAEVSRSFSVSAGSAYHEV